MFPPFAEQMLPPWKRAVLKVGSSLLAADGGGLTPRFALGLAQFVSANVLAGREVVIVSSGAVAAGRAIVPKAAEAGAAMAARQALAALGQAQLIGLWQRFSRQVVIRYHHLPALRFGSGNPRMTGNAMIHCQHNIWA